MSTIPRHKTREERQSLWLLTYSPLIWSAHFLLCYITAAVWCAKVVGRDGTLGPIRLTIGVYTVLALIGIGITGWRGYRRYTAGGKTSTPHDEDTPEDRYRFLGFATLLLSGMSAIGTIFVALVAIFFENCQ